MNRRTAVAVETDGNKELIAGHFGGSAKFSVYETDENNNIIKKEEYLNPLAGQHGGMCQLPAFIKQFNVNAILAGGMGQKAADNFEKFNISVITAPGKLPEEALMGYLKGELTGYEPCKHEHGDGHAHGEGHGHGHNCH